MALDNYRRYASRLALVAAGALATCHAAAESGGLGSVRHSGEAVGYSVTGAVQAVSAAAALPLALAGAAGAVSADVSELLLEVATAPIGEPLPITDEVVTVGPPPGEALGRPARR